MLTEPNCHRRGCRYFLGIKKDNEDESTERPICSAFPDGIPVAISFGETMHTSPYPGDHGIRFEPVKKPEP